MIVEKLRSRKYRLPEDRNCRAWNVADSIMRSRQTQECPWAPVSGWVEGVGFSFHVFLAMGLSSRITFLSTRLVRSTLSSWDCSVSGTKNYVKMTESNRGNNFQEGLST